MRYFDKHLNDEELLLAIDGELSGPRAKQAEEHLAECWDCRVRKQNLEKTIGNFVEARHAEFDAQVQPTAGLRSLFKANLEQIATEPQVKEKIPATAFRSARVRRAFVMAFAAAAAIAFIVGGVERIRIQNSAVYAEGPLEPRPNLTPGAVRTVNAPQTCAAFTVRTAPGVKFGRGSSGPSAYTAEF